MEVFKNAELTRVATKPLQCTLNSIPKCPRQLPACLTRQRKHLHAATSQLGLGLENDYIHVNTISVIVARAARFPLKLDDDTPIMTLLGKSMT